MTCVLILNWKGNYSRG